MAHIVKKMFKERHENFKLYRKGDAYSYDDEERIAFLVEQGYLEEVADQPKEPPRGEPAIKHTGGGWYELPNGEKIRGKEEAEQALAKLESGE